MQTSTSHLEELKNAYRVLDVPLSASEDLIKQSQRRLLKRWHPDLFPPGSAQYTDATEMSRLINDAYAKIVDAPLRHYTSAGTGAAMPQHHVTGMPRRKYEDDPNAFRNAKRVEFWVKFAIGGVFGAFTAAGGILHWYRHINTVSDRTDMAPWAAIAIIGAGVVVFGLGYAYTKNDEKFWDVVTPQPWWRRWPWEWRGRWPW